MGEKQTLSLALAQLSAASSEAERARFQQERSCRTRIWVFATNACVLHRRFGKYGCFVKVDHASASGKPNSKNSTAGQGTAGKRPTIEKTFQKRAGLAVLVDPIQDMLLGSKRIWIEGAKVPGQTSNI